MRSLFSLSLILFAGLVVLFGGDFETLQALLFGSPEGISMAILGGMALPTYRTVSEIQQIREVRKALEANDGTTTDIAQLSDGSALGQQFLDKTMVSIVSGEPHFKFLKQAPKRDIDQIIAEYNKYKSHGSSNVFRRNAFLGQSDNPAFDDVVLKRLYDNVAFMAQAYAYDKPITLTKNTQDPEVVQSTGALRRLLESLSFNIWHGDKDMNPYSPNGIVKTVSGLGSEFVYDARGTLPEHGLIADKAALIATRYFGTPNQIWMPNGTRNLYNQVYSQAGNVMVWQNESQNPGSIAIGNLAKYMLASEALDGKLALESERWIDNSNIGVTTVYDRATDSWVEGATSAKAPGTPSLALGAAGATSKFGAADAGTYGYRVSAVAYGEESQACVEITQAVVANDVVTLTITPAGSGEYATSFRVYRKDPGSSTHLYIGEFARDTVNATTTITDMNETLPGTSIMVLGDFNANSTDDTRTYVLSELLPAMKTNFSQGIGAGLRQFAGMVEWYGVLQLFAPEKFFIFKNVPVKAV